MSMFQEFNILFPYLQSVRKLKNYLSFDIEFPDTWKLPKKFVDEKSVLEITNIKNIIAYNKEREDKDRLFQQKIEELKNIFEKQKLNDLQGLKFEIKLPKIELEDDEEKQIGV